MTTKGEAQQFLAEVVLAYTGDECLIWPYARDGGGRARIKAKLQRRNIIVSRFVCESANGPPPTRAHQAAHNCGRGHLGCVTQNHLQWKTVIENSQDRYAHGTADSDLNEDKVREMRALGEGHLPLGELAVRYGVCKATVHNILRRKTWTWVSVNPALAGGQRS